MTRKLRLLISVLDAICQEIDRGFDLTFQERLWLENYELDAVIKPLAYEQEEHMVRLQHLVTIAFTHVPEDKEYVPEQNSLL